MNCVICKNGSTETGKVSIVFERGEAVVLIKNVPAQVCNTCGHYYLSSEIAKKILQIAQDAFQKGTELQIIKLPIAA